MSKKINILQGQSTEDLMAELKSRGKFVDNLWTIEDVQSRFNCTDDEAQEVLEQALTNDATMEQIWLAIQFHGEDNELEVAQFFSGAKVVVRDTEGLSDDTIAMIEKPMTHLGAWEQDGSVFADLRNSKDEAVRIFYDRLDSYEYESNWPSVTNLKG
jgi:hypothetical protein